MDSAAKGKGLSGNPNMVRSSEARRPRDHGRSLLVQQSEGAGAISYRCAGPEQQTGTEAEDITRTPLATGAALQTRLNPQTWYTSTAAVMNRAAQAAGRARFAG